MKPEDIIKVFALYLGSGAVIDDGTKAPVPINPFWLNHFEHDELLLRDCKLILRPLSSITDEEMNEVANWAYPEDDYEWFIARERGVTCAIHGQKRVFVWDNGDVFVDVDKRDTVTQNQHIITDYLRSRGFDLPTHYLDSCKKPSEMGLAILKDKA